MHIFVNISLRFQRCHINFSGVNDTAEVEYEAICETALDRE
jgi:hypothetical protein